MIDIRSFRDIVRLFYIFRRQFFIALWVTVALIVLGAFLWTPKYASEARLLVKPGRENLTVPIDVTDRATYAPQISQRDPIIDEEKMLTGRPVVTQVARLYLPELQLPAEAPPGFKNALKYHLKKAVNAVRDGIRSFTVLLGLSEAQSEEDRLASRLEDAFTVTHGPGSNVMELRFAWGDAVLAQRIMKTWVKVYTDERTLVLGRKTLVLFYDNKVRDTDQQIDSIKNQLRGRLDQINGISAEERLTAITKRLNDLRTRQSELLAERSALEQGAAYAAGRAKSLSKETVAERDVGYGPAWLALSNQLAELKRQRAEALRVFKESAPAIQALNESIASLESQLKSEDRPMQRGEKRGPNELSTLLARNELEKAVRLREILSLTEAFNKERDELVAARQQVLSKEPELARLEQALTVAERSRLLYLDSLEKARIDQALDDNRINNIAIIEDATFNPSRASPKSLVLLALALPAGAIVGLLVIYLYSVMDQRIHDGGRIEARFGVPLWSTVKDISGGAEDNDFHASLHRIYGTLPLAQVAERGLTVGLASSRSGEGVSFITQHLRQVLQAQGLAVVVDPASGKAQPGEVALLQASNLLSNRQAFLSLGKADLIVLVVEARASVVPVVDNALGVLRTAFRKVDGVILNRRRFEVPVRVMRFFQS
ncbi:GumC family protein [Aquabacterium sp.]|uniref:GumC family protein n=1 Tax=Aquabacterium sp. TaxID=1872578 RepID=UPI003D6CF0CA